MAGLRGDQRALFSGAKDDKSPLKRGCFSCFKDTPIGKAPGVGYLEDMGIGSRSVEIYRVTVSRWRWSFSIRPVFRAIIRRKYVSQRQIQYAEWATTGFTRVTNRWSCSSGVGQTEVCWHSRLASSM